MIIINISMRVGIKSPSKQFRLLITEAVAFIATQPNWSAFILLLFLTNKFISNNNASK